MARKAGQIIARGDRTWLVRVYIGRVPETQKRSYLNKTIHGIRRDAQEFLNRALVERDRRRSIVPTNVTVREYCGRWLETAAKPRVRSKTLVDYKGLLSRHVFPCIGDRLLTKLQPLDVQSFCSAMHGQGLSARTIRYAQMRASGYCTSCGAEFDRIAFDLAQQSNTGRLMKNAC